MTPETRGAAPAFDTVGVTTMPGCFMDLHRKKATMANAMSKPSHLRFPAAPRGGREIIAPPKTFGFDRLCLEKGGDRACTGAISGGGGPLAWWG